MSRSRNERRLARKALSGRVLNHPSVQRMRRNLRKGGGDAATEVYMLDDDGTGNRAYFDVYSMREWARMNLTSVRAPIDWPRVERLVSNGAVSEEHIFSHTVQRDLEPIIICRDAAGEGEDQIVDGGHRYVAFAMGVRAMGLNDVGIPAYILTKDQWSEFLIPDFVAEAFKFSQPN